MNTVEFKDSPVGRIPVDWDVVKLGDLFTFKNGKRPPVLNEGEIPIYGANGKMGLTSNYLKTKDKALIFGRVGSSGEVHLSKGCVWVSDNAIYTESYDSKRVNVHFMFYLIKFKDLKRFATKTTHPIITQTFINNFKVPLPPLEEQKRISEILQDVDGAIEKVNKEIGVTEKLKRGLMQRLLMEGINHTEFKDSHVGRIPVDWDVVNLEDVVEIHDNKRIPLSEKERIKMKGDYPYCGANGIIDYINDYIFNGEFVLLAEDGGDYSSFGSSAYIMNGKFWVNNHAHVIEALPSKITNRFLLHILIYLDLTHYVVGSTRKKLNQGIMRKIKIPLPPLEEQKRISEILQDVDRRLELLTERKVKLENIKRGLMNDLLTGKRRVRITS